MTDYPQPEPHPVDASASVNVGLAAAKSEADGIIRDKASPYWDSGHYQHRETGRDKCSVFKTVPFGFLLFLFHNIFNG